MPLNTDAKKNIIKKVISNQDYRAEESGAGLRNEEKDRKGALPIAQQRLCGFTPFGRYTQIALRYASGNFA